MTGAGANPEIWGFVISVLLAVISVLLTAHYRAIKDHIAEQKATNERLWQNIGTKVSDATCKERIAACTAREDLPELEAAFRRHSHTGLPADSVLYSRSTHGSVD